MQGPEREKLAGEAIHSSFFCCCVETGSQDGWELIVQLRGLAGLELTSLLSLGTASVSRDI